MKAHLAVLLCVLSLQLPANALEFSLASPTWTAAYKSPRDTWNGLRVLPYFGTSYAYDDEIHLLKTEIVPIVARWFERVLKVPKLNVNLKVPITYCGPADVPLEHQNVGVNADAIIYIVTASFRIHPYDKFSYGSACLLNVAAPYRVLAGTVWVQMDWFSGLSHNKKVDVIAKHFAQVLGFDSLLFEHYTKPDGNRYEENELHGTVMMAGALRHVLKLPTVLEKARVAFECPSLAGVRLSGEETNDTRFNFYQDNYAYFQRNFTNYLTLWSARMMLNDFMSDLIVSDRAEYSSVTMAMFHDSGWYEVNWEYTSAPRFAYRRGCAFFEAQCLNGTTPKSDEFCAPDQYSCSSDFTSKGPCSLIQYEAFIPDQFRYISNHTGGNAAVDYCTVLEGGETCLEGVSDVAWEEKCPDCRCFEGEYYPENSSAGRSAHCHRMTCDQGKAVIMINSELVECPLEGGNVTIRGFTGSLVCPSVDRICKPPPCKSLCSGRGKCTNGVCICESGFYGEDCALACDQSCLTCVAGSRVTCVTCRAGAHLKDGKCLCEEHFTMNSQGECVSQVACHPTCLSCFATSANSCWTCHSPAILSSTNSCECLAWTTKNDVGDCVPCPNGCAKCTYPDLADCLPARKLAAECAADEYLNFESNICEKRFPPSSSFSGRYLKDGEYKPCHNSCLTCSGGNEWECTSCRPDALMKANPGHCICRTSCSSDCFPCYAECLTCSEVDPFQCKTCRDKATFDSEFSRCRCNDGFFFDHTTYQCEPCHHSCATCFGPTPDNCNSCISAYDYLDGHVCLCNAGRYISLSYLQCKDCTPYCANCTSPACTDCEYGFGVNSTGLCVLQEGFYYDGEDGIAYPCPPYCLKCHYTVKPEMVCDKCNATFSMNPTTTACYCPINTALIPDEKICYLCHDPKCAQCDPSRLWYCNTCIEPYSRTQWWGACACLPGNYESNNKCLPCAPNCEVCTGPTPSECIACFDHFYMSGSTCLLCHPWCRGCNGPNDDNCTSCWHYSSLEPGFPNKCFCNFRVSEKTCYHLDSRDKCHPYCLECYGPSYRECLTCNSATSVLKQYIGGDVCDCYGGAICECLPDHRNSGTCWPCDYQCETCNDQGKCDSCYWWTRESTTDPGTCLCTRWDDHYYPSPDIFTCLKCHPKCQACSGPNEDNCTSCISDADLQPDHTCKCRGMAIMMPDGWCFVRDFFCLDEYCDSCRKLAHRVDYKRDKRWYNACYCSAQNDLGTGLYPDTMTGICHNCGPLCRNCARDTRVCWDCKRHSHLSYISPLGAPGFCECDEGYFASYEYEECLQCPPGCNSCESYTVCTGCQYGYEFTVSDGETRCDCFSPLCKCALGLFAVPPFDSCEVRCPTGFTGQDRKCFVVDNPKFMFTPTSIVSELRDLSGLLRARFGDPEVDDAEQDPRSPIPIYHNGLLFKAGKSAYITITGIGKDLVLAPVHYIELWQRGSTLLSIKRGGDDPTFQFAPGSISIKLVNATVPHHFSYSVQDISVTTWTLIRYEIQAYKYRLGTRIRMHRDNKQIFEQIIDGYFYRDDAFDELNPEITIWTDAEAQLGDFMIANGLWVEESPLPCGCERCTAAGSCLSDCGAMEYLKADLSCGQCDAACTFGCVRGNDCSRNVDPLCTDYSDFTECRGCKKQLTTFIDGVCGCKKSSHLQISNYTCVCDTFYKLEENKCKFVLDPLCRLSLNPPICSSCVPQAEIVDNLCVCIPHSTFSEASKSCNCDPYYLLIDKKCVFDPLCEVASKGGECQRCKSYASLDKGFCQCVKNASQSEDTLSCFCKEGYKPFENSCIPEYDPLCAEEADRHCVRCKAMATLNHGVCECSSITHFDNRTESCLCEGRTAFVDGSCVYSADPLCAQLRPDGSCSACKGLALPSGDSCKCVENAALSEDGFSCSCKSGLKPYGNLCITANDPLCIKNYGYHCSECLPLSLLVEGLCRCIEHASLINGKCVCGPLYAEYQGECVNTLDPLCTKLSAPGICGECKPLTIMKDGKCECVAHSAFEVSSSTCICTSHYFANGTSCDSYAGYLCSSPDGDSCTECSSLSTIVDGNCTCIEMAQYSPASESCECQSGYILLDGECISAVDPLCGQLGEDGKCVSCKPQAKFNRSRCACVDHSSYVAENSICQCNRRYLPTSAGCELDIDPLCASYNQNDECTDCKDLSVLRNELCACVRHANVIKPGQCACDPHYIAKLSENSCRFDPDPLCLDQMSPCRTCKPHSKLRGVYCYCDNKYSFNNNTSTCEYCDTFLQPTDITLSISMDFSLLTVSFSASISADVTCQSLFAESTFVKFGNKYECTWNTNRTSLNISMKDDATLVEEPLEFNSTTIILSNRPCTFRTLNFKVPLIYDGTRTVPVAIMNVPLTVPIGSTTLPLDGSYSFDSTGRLNYKWIITHSNGVKLKTEYEVFTTVSCPVVSLKFISSGTLFITLTVRNSIGLNDTTNASIELMQSPMVSATSNSLCIPACMQGSNCSQTTDPLCENYIDSSRCSKCKELATLIYGKCSCIKFAIMLPNNTCGCSVHARLASGICEFVPDPLCEDNAGSQTCAACVPFAEVVNDFCTCTPHSTYSPLSNACECDQHYLSNGTHCVFDLLCKTATGEVCSECQPQSTYDGTHCQCVANASLSANSTSCLCDENYKPFENKCIPKLDPLCIEEVDGICTQCKELAVRVEGICECPSEAYYDTITQSCFCRDGFLQLNESCVEISDPLCTALNVDGSCSVCKRLAVLDGATCHCIANSSLSDDGHSCSCNSDMKPYENTCITANDVLCAKLSGYLCSLCAPLSHLVNGLCQCVEHASFLSEECQCDSSYLKYQDTCILNTDPLCVKLASPGICEICKSLTTLADGLCTCILHAHFLDTNSTCACDRHYLEHGSLCEFIPDPLCTTHNASGDCIQCKSHSVPQDGVCTCVEHASTWLQSDLCDCDYHYKENENTCEYDPDVLCTTYDSTGNCTQCKPAAYLQDGVCTCGINSVLATDKKSCVCLPDFKVYYTKCIPSDDPLCTRLNGDLCVECAPLSTLVEGICTCSEITQYYSSSKSCECRSGYALLGGKCVSSVDPKCGQLGEDGKCVSCKPQAEFSGSTCVCTNHSSFVAENSICQCNRRYLPTLAGCELDKDPLCVSYNENDECTGCKDLSERDGELCKCVKHANNNQSNSTCQCNSRHLHTPAGCELDIDPLCVSYNENDECIGCKDLSEREGELCKCVKHANNTQSNSTCQCNSRYLPTQAGCELDRDPLCVSYNENDECTGCKDLSEREGELCKCVKHANNNQSNSTCQCNSRYLLTSEGCVLDIDPLCVSYNENEECTACKDLSEFEGELCKCVSHANVIEPGQCACDPHYIAKLSENKCKFDPDPLCLDTMSPCKTCKPHSKLRGVYCYCDNKYSFNNNTSTCEYCDTFLQPTDITLSISMDFSLLTVSFSASISADVTCQSLFAESTFVKFGNKYECTWNTIRTSLNISMKDDATLAEEPLEFNSTTIILSSRSCTFRTPNFKVPLIYDGTRTAPIAIIRVSQTVSISSLILSPDGSQSAIGVGRLKYKWIIKHSSGLKIMPEYDVFTTASSPAVDLKYLTIGTLFITLTVRNSIGLQDTTNTSVELTKDSILSVSLDMGSSVDITSENIAIVYTVVSNDNGQSGQKTYKWSYEGVSRPLPEVSKNPIDVLSMSKVPSALIIGKGALTPGFSYTYKMTVKQGRLSGSATLDVNVIPSELSLQLNRVSGTHPKDVRLTISAVNSQDPDNMPGNITFEWKCQENNSECKDESGSLLLRETTETDIAIEADKLRVDAVLNFTVTIRKDSRASAASVALTIVEPTGVAVILPPFFQNILRREYFVAVPIIETHYQTFFSWKQLFGATAVPDSLLDASYIAFFAYRLSAGTYKFEMTASTLVGIMKQEVSFLVQREPLGGKVTVSPTSGRELQDRFEFSTGGWIDPDGNYPLRYQFCAKFSESEQECLCLRELQGKFISKLSAGEYPIVVKAYNTHGSYGEAESSNVTVTRSSSHRRLSDISIKLSFLADAKDPGATLGVIATYSRSLSFDLDFYTLVLATLTDHLNVLFEITLEYFETFLGVVESLMAQSSSRDAVNAGKLLTLTNQTMARYGLKLSETLLTRVLGITSTLSTYAPKSAAKVTKSAITRFYLNHYPSTSPFTFTAPALQLVSMRQLVESVTAQTLEIGSASVAIPSGWLNSTSLLSSDVIDLQFFVSPGNCSQKVTVSLSKCGEYAGYNLQFVETVQLPLFNTTAPFNITLTVDSATEVECVGLDECGQWDSSLCSIVAEENGEVTISASSATSYSLRPIATSQPLTDYFASVVSEECLLCPSGCTACKSDTECTACEYGYELVTSGTTSLCECFSEMCKCSQGLQAISPFDFCEGICQTGFDPIDRKCVASENTKFVFRPISLGGGMLDQTQRFRAVLGNPDIEDVEKDVRSPIPIYQNGLLFRSGRSAYITIAGINEALILGPEHYIELWEKGTSSLSIQRGYKNPTFTYLTNKMSIKLTNNEIGSDVFEYSIPPVDATSWILVRYEIQAYKYRQGTRICIYRNNIQTFENVVLDYYYRDDAFNRENTEIKIWADGEMLLGDFIIANRLWTAEQGTPCACPHCTIAGSCLSGCGPMEFMNADQTCGQCDASCALGCVRENDCSRNIDPLCESYSNFTGCSGCKKLATLENGECSCIESTILLPNNICGCDVHSQLVSGACEFVPDPMCDSYTDPPNCAACVPLAEVVNDFCTCTPHSTFSPSSNACKCDQHYLSNGTHCVFDLLCKTATGEVCSECQPQSKYDGTLCQCVANASLSANSTSCLCNENYKPFENKCIPKLDPLCVEEVDGICTQCKELAVRVEGICECSSKAHYDAITHSCLCHDGFAQLNGKCVEVTDLLCILLNVDGSCSVCKRLAALNGATCQCVAGSSLSDDRLSCNCNSGLKPYENTCITANDVLCVRPSKDICLSCAPLSHSVNGLCQCVEHASLLNGECQCDTSYSNYQNTCYEATDPLCTKLASPGVCETCKSLTTLADGVCTCIPHAHFLDTNNTCACDRHYLEHNSLCEFIPDPLCTTHDATGDCIQCKSHSVSQDGVCVCAEHASTWLQPDLCDCDYHYKENENTCEYNPDILCDTYDSTGKCSQCKFAATLQEGACTCGINSVLAVDGKSCRCLPDFKVYHTKCIPSNDPLCISLNGDLCVGCAPFSTLVEGICTCVEMTQYSPSSKSCECKPGYASLNEKCVSTADPLCRQLRKDGKCASCKPQATLSGSRCACVSHSSYIVESSTCQCDRRYLPTSAGCELDRDLLCVSYNANDECTGCKSLSEFEGEMCKCVEHANTTQPGQCTCDPHYIARLSENMCEFDPDPLCLDSMSPCLTCKPHSTLQGVYCRCNSEYSFIKDTSTCEFCGVFLLPSDVSVSVSMDFSHIIVGFSASISADVTCQSLFVESTFVKFGSNHACKWSINRSVLFIILSDDASLVEEDLEFNATTIIQSNRPCTFQASNFKIPLIFNGVRVRPTALLQVPQIASVSCPNPITQLDASGTLGGVGLLRYKWTLTHSAGITLQSEYSTFTTENNIFLNLKSLPIGFLIVTLTVRDRLGQEDVTQRSIKLIQELEISVGFDVGISINVTSETRASVRTVVGNTCGQLEQKAYVWSYEGVNRPLSENNKNPVDVISASKMPNTLVIEKAALTPGFSYYYKVLVKEGSLSGSAMLTVNVVPSELKLRLSRVSGNHPKDVRLVVSAADSRDPDNMPGDIAFEWKCQENNSECKDESGSLLLREAIKTDIAIETDKLRVDAVLNFTVTIRKDSRITTTSVVLTIVEPTGISVLFLPSLSKILGHQNVAIAPKIETQNQATFSWKQLSASTATPNSPPGVSYLTFSANQLLAGSEYLFEMTAVTLVGTMKQEVSFSVLQRPVLGQTTVTPHSGRAVLDRFVFSTSGWVDPDGNYPLGYQFCAQLSTSTQICLCPRQLQGQSSSKLTAGKYPIVAKAYNSLGSYGESKSSNVIVEDIGLYRRLTDISMKDSFLSDVEDPEATLGMAAIYSRSLSLDQQLYTLILDTLTQDLSKLVEIDLQRFETFLGAVESLIVQSNRERMSAEQLLTLTERTMARYDLEMSETQLARVLGITSTLSTYAPEISATVMKSAVTQFYRNRYPSTSQFTFTASTLQLVSMRQLIESMTAQALEIGRVNVDIPSEWLSSTPSSDVIDMQFFVSPGNCSQEVTVSLSKCGEYTGYNLQFVETVPLLKSAAPFNITLAIDIDTEVECVGLDGNKHWVPSLCTVVAKDNREVTISAISATSYTLRQVVKNHPLPEGKFIPSASKSDNEDLNPTPLGLAALVVLSCLISVVVFKKNLLTSLNTNETVPPSPTGKKFVSSMSPTVPTLPSSEQQSSVSFWHHHALIYLLQARSVASVFLLATLIMTDLLVLGLCYTFWNEGDEAEDDTEEVFTSYSAQDMVYAGIAVVAGTAAYCLCRLAVWKQEKKGLVACGVLVALECAGVVVMNVFLGFGSGGRWGIGTLCTVLIQLLIIETVKTAVVFATSRTSTLSRELYSISIPSKEYRE